MKAMSKQITLLVLFDIIVAIGAFGLFYCLIEGIKIPRDVVNYVLLFLIIILVIQFIFILIKCIQSILRQNWKEFIAWVIFEILLSCLIDNVIYVVAIYFGFGSTLDGF